MRPPPVWPWSVQFSTANSFTFRQSQLLGQNERSTEIAPSAKCACTTWVRIEHGFSWKFDGEKYPSSIHGWCGGSRWFTHRSSWPSSSTSMTTHKTWTTPQTLLYVSLGLSFCLLWICERILGWPAAPLRIQIRTFGISLCRKMLKHGTSFSISRTTDHIPFRHKQQTTSASGWVVLLGIVNRKCNASNVLNRFET